jgi:nucleoside-diphosphate-sugar epimerase
MINFCLNKKIKILVTGGYGNIASMIKNNLKEIYDITNLGRKDLNVLSGKDIEKYLNENQFDILVHTAILGGRRTKEENGDITHNNLVMLENLLKFSDKFKMIINFDSAAIYDRSTDILNRKESDLFTIPIDYYGFSKYVIYQRSLMYNHFYNFRIFNIFHHNEEKDRFIKSCFLAKQNKTEITIFEDKYFDFMYEIDFIKIIKFYFNNVFSQEKLIKTINICYDEKYKLSEIAKIIINDNTKIKILKENCQNNYSGIPENLNKLNIDFIGLKKSLKIYEEKIKKD